VTLRLDLGGPWSLFGSINPKWSQVDTYSGSLLAEQRPFGMDGGLAVICAVGVLYDSRQPEIAPRSGMLLELSTRFSPPLPQQAGTFGGAMFSARGFTSPADWLTLAGRFMMEMLLGDIPFYEMVHWGGFTPVMGFGGSETLRGLSFGRFRAPGKALLNLEARFDLFRHAAGANNMVWQLALYSDVGGVFGAGDGATDEAPGIPLHPAAGAGLRVIYADAFVGRIDTGFGLDPVREEDGAVTQDPTFGIYVVFDHAF
jgi:hypothetical protein